MIDAFNGLAFSSSLAKHHQAEKGAKGVSLPAEKDVDHRTRSSVVLRYHLYSAGSRLCLSDGSNGLGQPLCAVLGGICDHG